MEPAKVLTVDSREVMEHPEIPTSFKIPCKVERLGSADYAFLDREFLPTGIERCEIGNLMQKIRNGELESQLIRCSQDYSKVLLLTEGVYDEVGGLIAHYKKSREGNSYFRTRIEPSFHYKEVKALEIRLSELGIETLWSPNFDASIHLIECVYEQRTKPESAHRIFKNLRPVKIPAKLSSNPAVPKLLSLCPRLDEKVAIRLVNQFGSIWNIIHSSDDELLSIEGFGRTSLNNMNKVLGKESD
jgi:ERCC4-type nuclease